MSRSIKISGALFLVLFIVALIFGGTENAAVASGLLAGNYYAFLVLLAGIAFSISYFASNVYKVGNTWKIGFKRVFSPNLLVLLLLMFQFLVGAYALPREEWAFVYVLFGWFWVALLTSIQLLSFIYTKLKSMYQHTEMPEKPVAGWERWLFILGLCSLLLLIALIIVNAVA